MLTPRYFEKMARIIRLIKQDTAANASINLLDAWKIPQWVLTGSVIHENDGQLHINEFHIMTESGVQRKLSTRCSSELSEFCRMGGFAYFDSPIQ